MISRRAESVVGVEIDPDALTHAPSRLRRPNLRYIGGDIRRVPEDGVLIISTPERTAYSDSRDVVNAFHEHEGVVHLELTDPLEEERDQLESRAEALAAEDAALRSSLGWRIIRRLGWTLSGLRSWRPRAS